MRKSEFKKMIQLSGMVLFAGAFFISSGAHAAEGSGHY